MQISDRSRYIGTLIYLTNKISSKMFTQKFRLSNGIIYFLFKPLYYISAVEPFFRKDYNYVGRQEAFYKLHTDAKTWPQARLWCAREGASLAYPETQSEATLLTSYMSQYLTKKETSNMWLGAHDLFYDGIFVNFQGKKSRTIL